MDWYCSGDSIHCFNQPSEMSSDDVYRTLSKPSNEILFKEKNSKFYGYAFPVQTEDDVKNRLEEIKKKHYNAGHWCYAYQLGKSKSTLVYRANDDGEPNNTAGMPIYGQIQSFDVTDVLVIVVRYFGGVKLGVGGLIQAYKTAAEMALSGSKIVKRTIKAHFELHFDYPVMNEVMRIIKSENLKIIHQTMNLDCRIEIAVRLKEADRIFGIYKAHANISIKRL